MRSALRFAAALLIVAALVCGSAVAQQASAAQSAKADVVPSVEEELVRLTNQERVKAGLPELKVEARLTAAARQHAALMAERGELAHDLSGEPNLSSRVAATGLRFNAVAENVSRSDEPNTAASVNRGLMNSPPHRENILGSQYNAIGIGAVRRGRDVFITEDFARAFADTPVQDVAQTVVNAVNRVRAQNKAAPLRFQHLDKLDAMACAAGTTLEGLLKAFPSGHSAVLYTTWNPDRLPKQMDSMVLDDSNTVLSVHACALSVESGGAGGFKIAAVFF